MTPASTAATAQRLSGAPQEGAAAPGHPPPTGGEKTGPALTGPLSGPLTGTIVTFELAGQCFALDVAGVREILDRQVITPMPNASPDCFGVIDNRGESIPVIDLARRLGLAAAPSRRAEAETRGDAGDAARALQKDSDERIIIVDRRPLGDDPGDRAVGLCADRVLDVRRLDEGEVERAPETGRADARDRSLRGLTRIGGRLVFLLDLEAALAQHP